MVIPGNKQENFLFSFPSLLLSDGVKTKHPEMDITSHSWKSWHKQTVFLRSKAFLFLFFFFLNHSPDDCKWKVNFLSDCELRVNNFLNHVWRRNCSSNGRVTETLLLQKSLATKEHLHITCPPVSRYFNCTWVTTESMRGTGALRNPQIVALNY